MMSREAADGVPADAALSVSRLRLAVLRVARRIRQDARTDLTPSQQSLVVMLDRYGPMSPGELASREAVRPPSVTRTIQALEAAGMVTRDGPEPGSRRVIIELTDAGRLAAVEIHERRDAWLSERLEDLPDEDLQALREALPALERLIGE
jgi:DNA-binding MarR family transcriptional regulator